MTDRAIIEEAVGRAVQVARLERDMQHLARGMENMTDRMADMEKLVWKAAGAVGLVATIFGSVAGAIVGKLM